MRRGRRRRGWRSRRRGRRRSRKRGRRRRRRRNGRSRRRRRRKVAGEEEIIQIPVETKDIISNLNCNKNEEKIIIGIRKNYSC